MPAKKILIVDDDADVRELLNMCLRQRNYETAYAVDAISAISTARRENPDLILLDLGLPAGEGYVVMERLKAIPSLGWLPIIVVSGRTDDVNRKRALAAGAKAFIQKPFRAETVLDAIQHELGKTE